jgi:hypothetical protein
VVICALLFLVFWDLLSFLLTFLWRSSAGLLKSPTAPVLYFLLFLLSSSLEAYGRGNRSREERRKTRRKWGCARPQGRGLGLKVFSFFIISIAWLSPFFELRSRQLVGNGEKEGK